MKFLHLLLLPLLAIFSVSCQKTLVSPETNYFPSTINSYWHYGLEGGTALDSFMIKVSSATLNANGNTYTLFTYDNVPASGFPNSLYYRESSGVLYEYFNAEEFFGFDAGTVNTPNVEYIFLKDNGAQGTTWNSPNITGKIGGVSYTFYIKMTLYEKMSNPTTVGSVTSSDLLKMRYEYFSITSNTPIYVEERWFAKSVGLVYNSFSDGNNTEVYKIGKYQVL